MKSCWSSFLVVGVLIPNAMIALAVVRSSRRTDKAEPSERFFAYAKLLASLRAQMNVETRRVDNGPLFVATIRELKEYPEYRAISLLFIEEITITGKKKLTMSRARSCKRLKRPCSKA